MDDINLLKQRILELLVDTPYELCARLKQRLNRSLCRDGFPPFNERAFKYKKFSDFLRAELSDAVRLELPSSAGDIRVSLKGTAPQIPERVAISPERPSSLRSDVWEAFTNPELKRKRFFNRLDHRILHFVEGVQDEYSAKWEENSQDYVEILPLTSDAQIAAMREFIDIIEPSPQEAEVFDQLLASNYTTGLNTSFVKLLGTARAEQWRKLRQAKVNEHISKWLAQHGINPSDLGARAKVVQAKDTAAPDLAETVLSIRQQAAKLLERMSEDEIARIAIPVLLSSVLSKHQL
ncbi:TPA: hypothetical protein ACVGNB_001865 [Pseudomonas aeruginosa]|nr:hypothetical protein [Pseudomonas aeruginosa]